jgi:hypothetical protein
MRKLVITSAAVAALAAPTIAIANASPASAASCSWVYHLELMSRGSAKLAENSTRNCGKGEPVYFLRVECAGHNVIQWVNGPKRHAPGNLTNNFSQANCPALAPSLSIAQEVNNPTWPNGKWYYQTIWHI